MTHWSSSNGCATTVRAHQDLPAAAWSNTVIHSENGGMTMDDWLDTYDRHIP